MHLPNSWLLLPLCMNRDQECELIGISCPHGFISTIKINFSTQCPVRITLSAGVCLCSDRDHPSPVSHCLSSQRLLQALLCSWCLQDLEQCQKENAKAWESTHPSNKWSLFTANSKSLFIFIVCHPRMTLLLAGVSVCQMLYISWMKPAFLHRPPSHWWFLEGTRHLSENSV